MGSIDTNSTYSLTHTPLWDRHSSTHIQTTHTSGGHPIIPRGHPHGDRDTPGGHTGTNAGLLAEGVGRPGVSALEPCSEARLYASHFVSLPSPDLAHLAASRAGVCRRRGTVQQTLRPAGSVGSGFSSTTLSLCDSGKSLDLWSLSFLSWKMGISMSLRSSNLCWPAGLAPSGCG